MTLFEELAGGVFDHQNYQNTREFDQNLSKKVRFPGVCVGTWAVLLLTGTLSSTLRRLTESLKPGFHMIATISTLALVVAIAEKKKFSYRSDHSDHMET